MSITKKIVAIGGGELREFTTLEVDTFIKSLYNNPEKRAYALFVPTASHDSKPYFNTFRKTYCSKLNCKVDVAILTKNEMTLEHIKEKVDLADIIYVGGGDTKYMLDVWKESGFLQVILQAYEEGKIICGLSAGAICWFEQAHSDYIKMQDESKEYAVIDGLGLIKGICIPHFDEQSRRDDAPKIASKFDTGYGICANSAIYFEDGEAKKTVGETYRIKDGSFEKFSL